MLLNTFDLDFSGVHIHLKLYDPVTVLFDKSGAGKSFIMNAVHNYVLNNPTCGYRVISVENFGLWEAMLSENKEILWFIDDIDLLAEMYPESVEYINSGTIPLVVSGRDFSKFKFNYRAYQRLNFNPVTEVLTNDISYI